MACLYTRDSQKLSVKHSESDPRFGQSLHYRFTKTLSVSKCPPHRACSISSIERPSQDCRERPQLALHALSQTSHSERVPFHSRPYQNIPSGVVSGPDSVRLISQSSAVQGRRWPWRVGENLCRIRPRSGPELRRLRPSSGVLRCAVRHGAMRSVCLTDWHGRGRVMSGEKAFSGLASASAPAHPSDLQTRSHTPAHTHRNTHTHLRGL